MDLGSALTHAVGWRWTPCIAPFLGSVAFVTFCITVVPDDIGPMNGPTRPSHEPADVGAALAPTIGTSGLEPPNKSDAPSPRERRGADPRPRVNEASHTIQSFFRPAEPLPLAPPDPDPGEPAAPPPPPAPTATIFTLPELPPVAAPTPVSSPPSVAVPTDEGVPTVPSPDTASGSPTP